MAMVGLSQGCFLSPVRFRILSHSNFRKRESSLVTSGLCLGFLFIEWSRWPLGTVTCSSCLEGLQLSVKTGPRTSWNDYIPQLAWERLDVPLEELVEASGSPS